MTTETKQLETGDRVTCKAKKSHGVVTMHDADYVQIQWDNGATGSFFRKWLAANEIEFEEKVP